MTTKKRKKEENSGRPQNTNGTENTQLGQMLDQMKRVTEAAAAAEVERSLSGEEQRGQRKRERERQAENSLQ